MAKTTKADVKKIVKYHLKFDLSDKDIEDVITATTHEVYPILLNGKKYIVRIGTKDKPKFYTEIWALTNQRKLSIPGPRMLKWDDSKKIIPYRYMIQEHVEGNHISWTDKKQIVTTYQKISKEILQKIHNHKNKGFGPLNEKGKGDFKTWKEFLEAKYQKAFPEIEQRELLSKKELKSISQIHKDNIGKIKIRSSKMIMGDLHPNNFFMKDGEFVGFVDLKAVMGGDPLWEYSLISFYLDVEIWPSYIKKTEATLIRYYFYMLNIAINKLWFSFKTNQPTDKIKKRIRKYLKEFPK